MHDRALQRFFAYSTLLFWPWCTFKFTGVSLTVADALLLMAIALNADELFRMHTFQLPLLLALPFMLISAMLDPAGGIIQVLQVVYIWGLLLPFGWVAFTSLTTPQIARTLLVSGSISSLVALGQFTGWLPEIGKQVIIDFGLSGRRAAGLCIACNSLAMTLTPFFLLLPYVHRPRWRITALLCLLGGLAATLSKACVLAVPGMLYYLWSEPSKKQVLKGLGVAALLTAILMEYHQGLVSFANMLNESVQHRMGYVEDSVDVRKHLIRIALGYTPECYFLGYGVSGTVERMTQSTGNTVHVYYLGHVLTGGLVASVLVMVGFGILTRSLWNSGERNFAVFLVAFLLSISVTTVLFLSFQYLPVAVAGSVLVNRHRMRTCTLQPQATNYSKAA